MHAYNLWWMYKMFDVIASGANEMVKALIYCREINLYERIKIEKLRIKLPEAAEYYANDDGDKEITLLQFAKDIKNYRACAMLLEDARQKVFEAISILDPLDPNRINLEGHYRRIGDELDNVQEEIAEEGFNAVVAHYENLHEELAGLDSDGE